MRIVLSCLAACAASFAAQAAEPVVATHTTLEDCAIQEVLPGKDMTGGYVRFVHTGAPVRLLRAEAPSISPRIELHQMVMKDNVMEMSPLTNLTLEAGERVFKKGGDHVMLFDIDQNPEVGSRHTLTVYFDDNTKASCEAVIKSVQDVMDAAQDHAQRHNH